VISTDATGALIQPAKTAKDGRAEACKKGHFFTAVVDCDAVLFAYVEHHSSESVKQLFGGLRGYLIRESPKHPRRGSFNGSRVSSAVHSRAAAGADSRSPKLEGRSCSRRGQRWRRSKMRSAR
jgi:hypothetical protein